MFPREAIEPVKYLDNKTHADAYSCPICGTQVGGYVIFGKGENDWAWEQDKFCKECGQKIRWG